MSRILILPCHSVLEHDELKLFHSLGHEVASIGSYINPAAPMDNLRPALPDVPMVDLVKFEVDALGQQGHTDTLEAAKRKIPDAILDWAEVIIVPGMEHTYLVPQWDRIKHKRVIWRTIGQSGDRNELMVRPLRSEGLQIVRYSPKERNIPNFAGEDALIRFYKDPDEWYGWHGTDPVVGNVTQALYQRSLADDGLLQAPGYQWTSYGYWEAATHGLPTKAAGRGSEMLPGAVGTIDYDTMRQYLKRIRAYLYTGTQPASYTLGFMEALMTGVPVVSITPEWYRILPYGWELLEAHEIAPLSGTPAQAREYLRRLLADEEYAAQISAESRAIAVSLFSMETIAAQWASFLDHQHDWRLDLSYPVMDSNPPLYTYTCACGERTAMHEQVAA